MGIRIGNRNVLFDDDNPARYNGYDSAVAGLVNGRLLRQQPRHLEDHPLKGKYILGDSGNLLTEGGWHSPKEMELYGSWAAKGAKKVRDITGLDFKESYDFVRRHTSPLQGMLFMPPDEQRHLPSTDYRVYRTSASGPLVVEDSEAAHRVHRNLIDSDMPSGLIKALRGQVNIEPDDGETGGWYTTSSGVISLADNGTRTHDPFTLIHELGHRADYRSHLAEGLSSPAPRVPALTHPNPRLEGIADGFYDRYSARHVGTGNFSHITNTGGYTTGYRGHTKEGRTWSDSDRAIYAAARAHFAETGENPTVPSKAPDGVSVLNNTDEYLHMMQRTSPHARKALMENDHLTETHGPLWSAAQNASRRYLADRKVGTQLSLIPGMEKDIYDDPYADGVSAEEHVKRRRTHLNSDQFDESDPRYARRMARTG